MSVLQSKDKKIEAIRDLLGNLVENENWPMTLLIGDYLSTLEPESLFAQRAQGYASLELHDLDAAENFLLKAIELGDSDPDTLIQIARVHAYRGDLNGQIQWLERALAENPDKVVASYFLALAYRSRGDPDLAEEILKEIIAKQPDLVPPRRALADLYLSLGNLDAAEEQLREAVMLRDGMSESLSDLGYILKKKGQFREALDEYFRALEKDPDNPSIYYDIGDTWLALDENEKAISYLRKACELDPDNSLFNYDLGLAYFNLQRYADCETASRDALKKDPEMQLGRTNLGINAMTNLGLAFLNQKKLTEAEACFRRNLQLTASSHFNLGLALHWQRRYDEALIQFLHAVELVPDDAPYWNMVGNAWMELDDLEQAKNAFERSIAVDPGYPPSHYDLGVIFSRMKGKEKEAMDRFMTAISLDDTFALPYYAIACLHALDGKKKEALEYLRKSVDLGFSNREHADADHDLDSIRGDPEFAAIMKKMGVKKGRRVNASARSKKRPKTREFGEGPAKKPLGSGKANECMKENWERYIW